MHPTMDLPRTESLKPFSVIDSLRLFFCIVENKEQCQK